MSGKFRAMVLTAGFIGVMTSGPVRAQQGGPKFVQDTIVVEAEGRVEADPDLATLTFDITSQD